MDLLLRQRSSVAKNLKTPIASFMMAASSDGSCLPVIGSWRGVVWEWHVNPPLPVPPWCNRDKEE